MQLRGLRRQVVLLPKANMQASEDSFFSDALSVAGSDHDERNLHETSKLQQEIRVKKILFTLCPQ